MITLAARRPEPGLRRPNAGDLWIHPRGETYDPEKHYRDAGGELYYLAENDIHAGLGRIVIRGGSEPSVTAELGPDILAVVERNSGWLQPVLHWDSDGDGRVDRTGWAGKLEGRTARFERRRRCKPDPAARRPLAAGHRLQGR